MQAQDPKSRLSTQSTFEFICLSLMCKKPLTQSGSRFVVSAAAYYSLTVASSAGEDRFGIPCY